MGRQDGDEGIESEEAGPSRPGTPVDLYRIRRALTRGKWWLLAAALIGSAAGYAVGKFGVKRTYEASATIQYVGQPGDPQYEVQRDLPGLVAAAHSEAVLFELRSRMGDIPAANLPALQAMVIVVSDPGNGLVSFTSSGDSPERAARMTNTALQSFLDFHLQRRREELDHELVSIGERTEAAQRELAAARRTYDAFRLAQGITDLSAEQEAAIDRAAELRSQADLGQAEVRSLEARVAQLRTELSQTERTHTISSRASTEQRRLRQLRQQLAEARGRGLGDSHPQVQALQRQVNSLERSTGATTTTRTGTNPVYSQIETTLQSTETDLEGARQRVASLEQLAATAQERITRFGAIEGQAASLLAQVNVKQALLNELNAERSAIDDQLSDVQTGFRTVSEARPPDSAVPSKKKYAVAAGMPIAFVAIMLGMLLYRELRGLTVHTAAEVAFWGNGPVIGTTKWPRDPRALLDLIADLDDFAPDARGTMLVVGGTDADRELAVEIASQLNHDWTASTLIDVPVMGALPSNASPSSAPPRGGGYYDDDDDVLSGEIHDGPTEFSIPQHADLALIDLPTEVERPQEALLGDDRLICTAWTHGSEGQALRRAARLADRVLVVVTSGGLRASELATVRTRLGVQDTIGYVLTGVSDEVSRLPDRSGPVESFWAIPER